QVAAAQWQQVQQQRVGLQYQALMQHHEKLQKILEQYQQLIQQTSMSTEMQLRHYEMQQQHFTPLFQNWEHSFALWYGQFQTYPHKDQLKDYELQWKQWQEQMNATKAHLQERVTALTPMVQFPPGQYNSGTMGKYSQYPGHENRINQQPAVQNPVGALGPSSQGSQPPQFDGPPRFDQPQQQSERPPRFHLPQHHFDGPPRFDQPPRFNGPPRFDQPPQRFDGPTRFNQPGQRFEGPPRFDQPRQRFDGPQRFEQPPFGQQSRHEQFQRHSGPPPNFEHPPVPQQKPQPSHQHKPEIETKQAASIDINTPGKPDVQLKPEKEKKNSGPDVKTGSDDLTNDNLLVNEGFFLQNDPIPQTAGANEKEKNSSADGVPDKSVTSKPPNSSSSTNAISSVKSLSSPVNKPVKPDDTETNKKPPAIGIPLEAQSPKKPVEIYLSPDPMRTGSGRGRGQPPGPAEMRGRGRGQRGHGDFRGNTMSHGKDTEETSYGYQPPEEDMVMSEEQQDYYWQDPSYEEGGHPFMRGRPPMTRGGPPMMRGGHPSMRGSPQMIRGGISMMRGGPPMARGGPPMPRGGPPMARGGPPMPRGGPPMPRGGLLMAKGGAPLGKGGAPYAARWSTYGTRRSTDATRGGLWRPGPEHEAFKEGYREGFVDDFSHGEDGYRHRPPLDYPPDGYHRDPEHYDRERGYALPERDFPHRPPEAYGDGPWREEREKDHPYPYDERDRERAELRIREYRDEPPYPPSAQPSEWDRPTRHAPLPERDYEDGRPCYEHRGEPPLDKLQSFPLTPGTNLPESSVEKSQGTNSGNVLALSQRQHEIILKAAQELKLIREMQEGKTPGPEPQPSKTLPELPAGLLGLEIPQDVRNVLKGMSAAAVQTPTAEPASWDLKPPLKDYSSTVQAPPTVIPKTLDYAHGHESGTTVERISYGERIVLRPDPNCKSDPYSRDPYYERRGDPYMERREYSRERELYREKLPPDYERERFDRERYPPREREDSRDRIDDPYRRPGYDRPPYERSGLDRSAPELDRRSYHEDRGPAIPPPLPPPPQPAPRVEKKPEIKNIDDILKQPGRQSRPERIVIILRGLPGSGKSHVAKLIRDKEVECGGAPPRVLVLDDYFMTEVEKVEKDPDTGRRIKTKVLEYEYEPEMEDTYRNSMLKTFKKTLDDGFFPFIILDSVNDRVKHFDQFWSAAKTKGFEVGYLASLMHFNCVYSKESMSSSWEPSPRHMVRLDVRSLLQDAAIEEVRSPALKHKHTLSSKHRPSLGYIPKSKWEMDTSEAKLDKLDGLGSSGKRKRDGDMADLEDYLQLPDDYATRLSQPGKKRVRWADLEEQKDADRKRAIGFVVGQTDWERITDESGKLAQRALNRTKYF
uniref:YLP motif-containing protein 1 n=1 Tax=Cynoglossus semilaevis TaxID=244447 RepID=A0A3P8X404_CYNSE